MHASVCVQAWRVAHPPVRGQPWLFSQPLVHMGFLKSWLAGGLNEKVVNRILQLVQARPAQPHAKPLRIYVTGSPICCFTVTLDHGQTSVTLSVPLL